MNVNDRLYTKEMDGTFAKWYVYAFYGSQFAVSAVKNAKLKDLKKYYNMDDIGKKIFLSRKDAEQSML